MGFGIRTSDERVAADARRFLGSWQVDLSRDGELQIKPLLADLAYSDLFDLVQRLLASGIVGDVAFTFDCSGLRTVETPWTAVFALWLHLARLAPRGCRLRGLTGQPASMAALAFRGVPQSLISVELAQTRDAA